MGNIGSRKEIQMFEKGEYVAVGSKGVCFVENVTTLDIVSVDKERKYYILKPLSMQGSTVYVPVDTAEESMREVISRKKAMELLTRIGELPILSTENEKAVEQEYRACLRMNTCTEWIRLLKTIATRKGMRLEAGRKVTSIDMKYERIAKDLLYGELAVALDMEKEEVEACVQHKLADWISKKDFTSAAKSTMISP